MLFEVENITLKARQTRSRWYGYNILRIDEGEADDGDRSERNAVKRKTKNEVDGQHQ